MHNKRALEGQNAEFLMSGRGICSTFCLNWIVFDHLTDRMVPLGSILKSDLHRCLLGSNFSIDGTSKLDFLKKEKNPTKQAAQNTISKGCDRSRTVKIPAKILAVTGSFWEVALPLNLWIPFKIEDRYQFSDNGFPYPNSRCMIRTTFRYWRMDEKHSFEARKATYLPKFTEDTGTGLIAIQDQNLRYIACWLLYVLRVEAAKAVMRNLATSLSNALVTFSLVQGSVKKKE